MVGQDPGDSPGQEVPALPCSAPAVWCLLATSLSPVIVGRREPGPGWDPRQSLGRNAAGKATRSQRLTERKSWLVKEV